MLPAFRFPKNREHPHAKIEPHKTKKRLRKTKFEKWEGGWLKKYEANLQEETTAGRIFPSAQRDLHSGIERRGDCRVRISAVCRASTEKGWEKGGETRLGLVRACEQFCGPGRGTDTSEAPHTPCWGRVGQLWTNPGHRRTGMRESQPLHAGGRTNGQKKGRKRKSRPSRACKGNDLGHGIALDGKRNFPPLSGQAWRGRRAAHITQTLSSQRRV